MSYQTQLNTVLETLLRNHPLEMTAKQLIHCLDLTVLDADARLETLSQLKNDAQNNQVAAVCVYTQHLSLFFPLETVELATVINFPQGKEESSHSLNAIEEAIRFNATEIDYVFPYSLYLEGKKQEALKRCQTIIDFCHQHHLTLKIILETGAFSEMHDVYNISKNLAESGCNFIKTSTGKIPQGATLTSVFAILSALKNTPTDCGIKISGGVKTAAQAFNYAKLAQLVLEKNINKNWFRIGASSLLGELTLVPNVKPF